MGSRMGLYGFGSQAGDVNKLQEDLKARQQPSLVPEGTGMLSEEELAKRGLLEQQYDVMQMGGAGTEGGGYEPPGDDGEKETKKTMDDFMWNEDITDELANLDRRKQKLDNLGDSIHQWRKSQGGVNIKPFLQWVDAETGSNFARGHRDPASQDELDDQAAKHLKGVEREKTTIDRLKTKLYNFKQQRKAFSKKEAMKEFGKGERAATKKGQTEASYRANRKQAIAEAEDFVDNNDALFQRYIDAKYTEDEQENMDVFLLKKEFATDLLTNQYNTKGAQTAVDNLKDIAGSY